MKYLFLLICTAVSLFAGDVTGKWSGTLILQGPDGEKTVPAHLELKQEDSKLTGTAGPDASEQHPIQNGKAEDGRLTFELATDGAIMKFALTEAGDEIKGNVSREREGESSSAKLSVKRDK